MFGAGNVTLVTLEACRMPTGAPQDVTAARPLIASERLCEPASSASVSVAVAS